MRKWKSLSCFRLCDPMDYRPEYCSGQPFPSPWVFPTQDSNSGLPHCRKILCQLSHRKPKNTGVGSLSLLQGIFRTQESNQGVLHCRQILYLLRYQGSPNNEKYHNLMKQGAQVWVVPGLGNSAVDVPRESVWTTFHVANPHVSPTARWPTSCTEVMTAIPGHGKAHWKMQTWKGTERRGMAPLKLPQEPGIPMRRFALPSA